MESREERTLRKVLSNLPKNPPLRKRIRRNIATCAPSIRARSQGRLTNARRKGKSGKGHFKRN